MNERLRENKVRVVDSSSDSLPSVRLRLKY